MDAPPPARRRGGRIAAAVALAWIWAAAPTRAEPLVRELPDREPAAEQALRRGGLPPADAAPPLSVVRPSGLPVEEAPTEVAEAGPLDGARALALVLLIPSGLYFVEKGTQTNVFPGPTDVTVLDTKDVTDHHVTDHHVNETPEPASMVLGLLGLALGCGAVWRRRLRVRRTALQPA
jgi:hypothetical protein